MDDKNQYWINTNLMQL